MKSLPSPSTVSQIKVERAFSIGTPLLCSPGTRRPWQVLSILYQRHKKMLFDSPFQIQIDIFFLPNNKTAAFPLPKLNFCTLNSVSKQVPFMSDLVKLVEKYAKGPGLTRCPLTVGFYQLENIYIDDSGIKELMWLRPNSKYMAHIIITDENGPKPVEIASAKYYVLFKTSKQKRF
jgi:hypothetical protein